MLSERFDAHGGVCMGRVCHCSLAVNIYRWALWPGMQWLSCRRAVEGLELAYHADGKAQKTGKGGPHHVC